jgi:threonyl-tRNA synthetase
MDFNLFSFDKEVETNEVKISQRKTKIQETLKTKSFLKKIKSKPSFK